MWGTNFLAELRKRWLYSLQRGKTPNPRKKVSWVWHWITSGSESMWEDELNLSLKLFPGPLWPGLELAVREPTMDQIASVCNLLESDWNI